MGYSGSRTSVSQAERLIASFYTINSSQMDLQSFVEGLFSVGGESLTTYKINFTINLSVHRCSNLINLDDVDVSKMEQAELDILNARMK